MGTDQRFRLQHYQPHLQTAFDSMLEERDFVDVSLGCEGRKLPAHKMLISAFSPYFRLLLQGNPCPHPIIILRDIKYDDMISLLQFMYKGEVLVAQDQLDSFLKTADTLQIGGLTDSDGIWGGNKSAKSALPPLAQNSPAQDLSPPAARRKRPNHEAATEHSPSPQEPPEVAQPATPQDRPEPEPDNRHEPSEDMEEEERIERYEMQQAKLRQARAATISTPPSLTPDQQEELDRLQTGHSRPSIAFLASSDLPVMGSLALVPEAELEDDNLEEVMVDDIVEEEIKMHVDSEEKSDRLVGKGGRGLELYRVTGRQIPARPSIYSSFCTSIENTRPPKVICNICGALYIRKNFSKHMKSKHLPEEDCSTCGGEFPASIINKHKRTCKSLQSKVVVKANNEVKQFKQNLINRFHEKKGQLKNLEVKVKDIKDVLQQGGTMAPHPHTEQLELSDSAGTDTAPLLLLSTFH